MARRNYYSAVSRSRRPKSYTVAVVLSIVLVLLVGFIVWCVIVFSSGGDGAFQSQAKDISELKMALNEKDEQIKRLTDQLEQYEGKGIALSDGMVGPPVATPTPLPTLTPTPQPRRTAPPAPTAPPTAAPTPPPAATQAPQNTPAVRQSAAPPVTTQSPVSPGGGI